MNESGTTGLVIVFIIAFSVFLVYLGHKLRGASG